MRKVTINIAFLTAVTWIRLKPITHSTPRPYAFCFDSKIPWLTVSNAFLRSKKTTALTRPWSRVVATLRRSGEYQGRVCVFVNKDTISGL